MNNFFRETGYSNNALILIAFFLLIYYSLNGIWKENKMTVDAPSYYTYLPAAFVYHDINLNFIDSNKDFFKDKIWYYRLENGNRLIKHTMGVSVMLLPFFLMAHLLSELLNFPADGYGLIYQNFSAIGILLYLMMGLFFLNKFLRNYFQDKIIAIVLIAVVICTNLLYYVSHESLMNHGVSFAVLCFCMFAFQRWLSHQGKKYFYFFCAGFGLLLLIRPLAVINGLFFIVLFLFEKKSLKSIRIFFLSEWKSLLIGFTMVLLVFSPQMIYWKYITGHFWFDAYIDEHLYLTRPEFFQFLLSFRKGWLVYTPVVWFAVAGFIFLWKSHRQFFYAVLSVVLVSAYVYSSWWAWSFGFCFGMRPMVDSYSFLSIPFAACFGYLFKRNILIKIFVTVLLVLLASLNLFQAWQYRHGLIHFDYMTREAYFKGFFQTEISDDWLDLLKPYDFERRKKGLPQIKYSQKFLNAITPLDAVFIRGKNLKFVSVSNPYHALLCNVSKVSSPEVISLAKLNGNTVSLKMSNGKFASVKPELDYLLLADSDSAGLNEKFLMKLICEGDNKISVQSANGKYLTLSPGIAGALSATSDSASGNSIFRIFVEKQ